MPGGKHPPGLFRLSRLLRGRRGTEWASTGHQVGERFCLLNPAALAKIDLPGGAIGGLVSVVSHGVGDAAPLPVLQRLVSGEAMRPPSVCHLQALRDGSSICLSWVCRSHRGWGWNDGVGDPSDSFTERYRVTASGPAGQLELETETPATIVDVGALPAEAGQTVEIEVRMIGPMATSPPRGINLIV